VYTTFIVFMFIMEISHTIVSKELINQVNKLFERGGDNGSDVKCRLYIKPNGTLGIKILYNYFHKLKAGSNIFMATGNTCETFGVLNNSINSTRAFFAQAESMENSPLKDFLYSAHQHFNRLFGATQGQRRGTLNHHNGHNYSGLDTALINAIYPFQWCSFSLVGGDRAITRRAHHPLCSFSAGDTFTDTLFHLLPETLRQLNPTQQEQDRRAKKVQIKVILNSDTANQEKLQAIGALAHIAECPNLPDAQNCFSQVYWNRLINGDDEEDVTLDDSVISNVWRGFSGLSGWVNEGCTYMEVAVGNSNAKNLVVLIQQYVAAFALVYKSSYPQTVINFGERFNESTRDGVPNEKNAAIIINQAIRADQNSLKDTLFQVCMMHAELNLSLERAATLKQEVNAIFEAFVNSVNINMKVRGQDDTQHVDETLFTYMQNDDGSECQDCWLFEEQLVAAYFEIYGNDRCFQYVPFPYCIDQASIPVTQPTQQSVYTLPATPSITPFRLPLSESSRKAAQSSQPAAPKKLYSSDVPFFFSQDGLYQLAFLVANIASGGLLFLIYTGMKGGKDSIIPKCFPKSDVCFMLLLIGNGFSIGIVTALFVLIVNIVNRCKEQPLWYNPLSIHSSSSGKESSNRR
jgi:hypothetical protein